MASLLKAEQSQLLQYPRINQVFPIRDPLHDSSLDLLYCVLISVVPGTPEQDQYSRGE